MWPFWPWTPTGHFWASSHVKHWKCKHSRLNQRQCLLILSGKQNTSTPKASIDHPFWRPHKSCWNMKEGMFYRATAHSNHFYHSWPFGANEGIHLMQRELNRTVWTLSELVLLLSVVVFWLTHTSWRAESRPALSGWCLCVVQGHGRPVYIHRESHLGCSQTVCLWPFRPLVKQRKS